MPIVLSRWDHQRRQRYYQFSVKRTVGIYNMGPSSKCRIYTSVNIFIIASGNGLCPVRRKVCTWTNTDRLRIKPSKYSVVWYKYKYFPCRKCNSKSCLSWISHNVQAEINAFERKCLISVLKLCRTLFTSLQLTIRQRWFRQWFGTEKATSHYLNNDGLL